MQQILDYLKKAYNPLAIVTYGSFACGTNDEYSDYDCMIIVNNKEKSHDDVIIDNIPLDCFIFTRDEISNEDIDAFITVYDGNIIVDTDGIAADLKNRVHSYVADHSIIPDEEKKFIVSWILKTIHRAKKDDDEGNYRILAFLWESLSDYFLLRNMFYFGSKKAVAYLKKNDPKGYTLYHNALAERTNAAINKWAEYVIQIG